MEDLVQIVLGDYHRLRFFFLVGPVRIGALLLNLSEHLCHVFHLIPDIKAHEDRSGLLSRHGDTIAGPRIDLDDLLLLRFVLRAEDKSRKIGAVLQVVDDYPIDLRSERSQCVCYQIMSEGCAPFACLA